MVGLPGDTLDTILDSMEFAVKMRANWTQFTVATPFIGMPMHDWAVKQGFVDLEPIQTAKTPELGTPWAHEKWDGTALDFRFLKIRSV